MQKWFFRSALLCGLCFSSVLYGQNYQAIHGSSMAGALGAANNPASIVHVPFSWDVTVFSVQAKHTTNAFYIDGVSLLSHSKNPQAWGYNETGKRFALANQDIHLLNARIRLNQRQAIAFGINMKSYEHGRSSPFTFSDTATDVRDFMALNKGNVPVSGKLQATAWTEFFATYAQTLVDNERSILNAGITLNITRGVAAGYARAGNFGVTSLPFTDPTSYALTSGSVEYGYSANVDDADAATNNKRSAFMRTTTSSVSFSAGAEYILPAEKAGDEANGYNYDLKLGVSLLDLGFNDYKYSANSRLYNFSGSIPDSVIQRRVENVGSIEELNDSLSTLATSVYNINGFFRVFQPARIVLNVDKHIEGNFFINGELTIPLTPLLGNKQLAARSMNLFAVTPRVENRLFGVYLPITVNTQGQIWAGGAFKAGPLLLGLHNWGNVFSNQKIQKGGFYLAVTFRPGRKHVNTERDTQRPMSKKARRALDCPSF